MMSIACWNPDGSKLALGRQNNIIIYETDAWIELESKQSPYELNGYSAHFVKWLDEDIIFVGYQKNNQEEDEDDEINAVLFNGSKKTILGEIASSSFVPEKQHQFFVEYLPDWGMLFVGSSISTDIECLVWDDETSVWEMWKADENYRGRMPAEAYEETFPMSMILVLNSQSVVPGDTLDGSYAPMPLIWCATSAGLLVNFAFVDMEFGFTESDGFEPIEFIIEAPKNASPPTFEVLGDVDEAAEEAAAEEEAADEEAAAEEETVGEEAAEEEKVDESYGKNDINTFASDDEDSDDDNEEAKEQERQSARLVFDGLDASQSGFLPKESFRQLLTSCGAKYCAETHAKTIEKLVIDGNFTKEAFANWYAKWLIDDEEEEDESIPNTSINVEVVENEIVDNVSIASTTSEDLYNTSMSRFQGEWNCTTCSVWNDPETFECQACSAPNPDASESIEAAFSPHLNAFPASEAYGQNDLNTFASDDDSDGDDEVEMEEEREKARAAFDRVDATSQGWIPSESFTTLISACKATFNEKEHNKAIKELSHDGRIQREEFVLWLVHWMFSDQESDDDEESEGEKVDDSLKSTSSPIANPLAALAALNAGSWKCSVCSIQNKKDARSCIACETVNPEAPPQAATPSSTSTTEGSTSLVFGVSEGTASSIGVGGFSFSGTTASFGSGNATGLTFGNASSGAPITFGVPTTTSSDKASPTPFTPFGASGSKTSSTPVFGFPAMSTSSTPAFGVETTKPKAASCYPPDTSSKAAVPKFGAAAPAPKSASGYPPDTSSKAAVPKFGAAAPAPKAASGYPLDTTFKAAAPKFGAAAASPKASSGYPPETSSKALPSPFGVTPSPFGSASTGQTNWNLKPPQSPFGAPKISKAGSAFSSVASSQPSSVFGTTASSGPSKSSFQFPSSFSTPVVESASFSSSRPALSELNEQVRYIDCILFISLYTFK